MSAPLKRETREAATENESESVAFDRVTRTRHQKYLRDFNAFVLPVSLSVVVQACIYILVVLRAGWDDYIPIIVAVGCITFIPVFSALTLTAFRRHEAPITASALVTLVFSAFAIAVVSALRVRVSYTGFSAALLPTIFILAYANLQFHRATFQRVALLRFPKSGAVSVLLGGEIPIVWNPDEDITDLDAVLIDPEEHHSERWSPLLMRCHMAGVEVIPWTRFVEIRAGRVDIQRFEFSNIAYSPSQLAYWQAKRVLDIGAVFVTLPATLPLAALTAMFILIRDGRPVLIGQERRGYGGLPFRMYKFRTMYTGMEGGATARNDQRIIKGCGIIRRCRLDELPQFYNIVHGDMSLIGPRPMAESIATRCSLAEPIFALRTLVKPGLTGWAQVKSGYAETIQEEIEKLSYDLYYIKAISLDLDLLVLFKTLQILVSGSGAR